MIEDYKSTNLISTIIRRWVVGCIIIFKTTILNSQITTVTITSIENYPNNFDRTAVFISS